MRILLLSDIHANPWALRAVCTDVHAAEHTLCAGDSVNYGPDPASVIHWLRNHQAVTVRGNHDNAVAFAADPKASLAKEALALAMRDWTRDQLEPADMAWLLTLERQVLWEEGGVRFLILHATPQDRLYDYRLTPDVSDSLLLELTRSVKADVLVVGHTHLPLLRRARNLTIVNPGSVGQPLDGDPRASYAVWEDGEITLHRVKYDCQAAVDALAQLPLNQEMIGKLQTTLLQGRMA
jgi:putative phosphoesterase